MSEAPDLPSEVLLELVAAGAIDPDHVHLPPQDRCVCLHQGEAHTELLLPLAEAGRGRCRAKKCPCTAYARDLRFIIPRGNFTLRKVPVRIVDSRQDGAVKAEVIGAGNYSPGI